MYNIVFLLTHVPNPRINKRLSIALECGKVVVLCTRRKSQNLFEPTLNGIEHIILDIDLPSSRHLVKRYVVSLKYQRDAYTRLAESQPNLIYAEGLDSLIIANQYKANHPNVSIFFEVADLRECFIEKPSSFLDRITAKTIARVECKNFRTVDRLIVTSMKFYDMHYCDLIDRDKVLYMPNTPDPAPFASYHRKNGGEFTVGFIGGIRYLNQMKMLVDAAPEAGCHVLFAGAGGTNDDFTVITEYCNGKENVTFTGKYNYDKDISRLYSSVDCIYAVYDATNANVRIALPNKLYEAIYCELPIIVSKGTYLAELVEKWGVGIAVPDNDPNELKNALKKLSTDAPFYNAIVNNCRVSKANIDPAPYNRRLSAVFNKCK